MRDVFIPEAKKCDGHLHHGASTPDALYDTPTVYGSWANLCQPCMDSFGRRSDSLTKRLVVGEAPERTRADIRRELYAAIEAGDFEAAFDACGDEDPTLYL